MDVDTDAWLQKFPGYENQLPALTRDMQLPERVVFNAIFDVIETSDFPINDVGWTLMSRRMLDVLVSLGPFPHKAHPVVMRDCKVIRFENGKSVLSGKEDHRFVCVQLLEHLDLFDWDNSDYDPHPRMPNYVDWVRHLALRKPPNGFPPLFRISASVSPLFVSAAGKAALEAADIRGVEYIDSRAYSG